MQLHNQAIRLKNNMPPTSGNLQENQSSNSKALILDEQIATSSKQVSVSLTSRNMVGLTKRKNGRYGVTIHDRIRKKDLWLGTFDSSEEASRVYWAKKEELEKEFEVHVSKKARVCEVKRTSEYVGVSKRDSGKFAAHIRDPIRRKKLYLGAFDSEEEASRVYLAKKAELEKESKGKMGVRWLSRRECRKPTSNQIRKRRNFGDSIRCLEKTPCLDNVESPMEIDNFGLDNNGESGGLREGNTLLLEGNNDNQCSKNNQESSKDIDDSLIDDSLDYYSSILDENNDSPCSKDNQESSKDVDDHTNSSILGEDDDNPCSEENNNQEPSKEIDHHDSSILVENNDTSCSKDNNQEPSKVIDHHDTSIIVENSDNPCLDANEEFLKDIEHNVSSHQEYVSMEATASGEDLRIEKNGEEEELIVMNSSGESLVSLARCPDAKILLRTKSGTPVMDSNGILLGKWSWIDDLSLPITM